jgi:hypothetical protein
MAEKIGALRTRGCRETLFLLWQLIHKTQVPFMRRRMGTMPRAALLVEYSGARVEEQPGTQ